MNNLPLVSVVIPVFNEEKYLSICIESVLSQNYSNIECIIMNNCSTDASLEIANRYGKRDNRIIIYSNDRFLSMMENHNLALQYISPLSKYCKMVLGDDFIFHDCIEKMVEVAESCNKIGVVASYRLLGKDVAGLGLPIADNPKGYSVFNGRIVCKYQLLRGDIYIFGNQTAVMYKSDIVRNRKIFFNMSSMFADAEVCFEILKEHDFGFINQVLSYTRTDNISLTSSILDYRPALPAKMEFLYKYGKFYLNQLEYNDRYNSLMEEYYDYLGWKYVMHKKRDFWEFHEKELLKIDIKLNKYRIFKHSIKYIFAMFFTTCLKYLKMSF